MRGSALFLVAALVACTGARMGHPIHPDDVPSIEVGVTTEAEIRDLLGVPTRTERRADGSATLFYETVEIRARDTGKLTQFLCWLARIGVPVLCAGSPWNLRKELETRLEIDIEIAPNSTVADFTIAYEERPITIVYLHEADPVISMPEAAPAGP